MSKRALALIVGVVALVVGLWLGGHPDKLPGGLRDVFVDQSAEVSDQVLQEIEDNYWKKVDSTDLQNASANGMVDHIRREFHDKFSHYLDPDQAKQLEQSDKGQFSGVGLLITQVEQGLRVSHVYANSPADKAGLKTGDVITAVDGKSIAGTDSAVATALIKGDPGTKVTLTVLQPGKPPSKDFEMERANIDLPVVAGRVIKAGGTPVAYVRMAQFTEGVSGALRAKIENLRAKGAKGLILDLRSNPGGLLTEAVDSASIFQSSGVVVTTNSRTQGQKVYTATGDALSRQPTVVLVNRDTASASEILSSALAENHLATVVGTRTYGKGVFQQVIPLDSGGSLDLTIGQYLTSNGTSIAGVGVQPQVKVRAKAPPAATLNKGRAVLAGELNK